MAGKTGGRQGQASQKQQGSAKRSWLRSIAASAAVVGVAILISATVNPLFDRAVHWDWMAVLAPTLLILLTVALRNRWA